MRKKENKPVYYEAVGRRKTAVCRLRLYEKTKQKLVNKKSFEDYFRAPKLQKVCLEPLETIKKTAGFGFSAFLRGGGIVSQAEALRHGLSRALVKLDEKFQPELKIFDFLKRDPRMKERRKFGLKKARKAPLWSKR